MIIDSKGKLFGKVSIVDIIIVLIVVLAIVFVGYKYTKTKTTSPDKSQSVQMSFYIEETNDFTANSIKVGDKVVDFIQNSTMGSVTKVEVAPSVSYANNSEGKFVTSTKEGYSSVKVTIEGKGILTSNGLSIFGNTYLIGQNYNVKIGNVQFEKARVSNIGKKG
jgi:hypothetical protein